MIGEPASHPFRAFAGAVALALVASALALAIAALLAALHIGLLL